MANALATVCTGGGRRVAVLFPRRLDPVPARVRADQLVCHLGSLAWVVLLRRRVRHQRRADDGRVGGGLDSIGAVVCHSAALPEGWPDRRWTDRMSRPQSRIASVQAYVLVGDKDYVGGAGLQSISATVGVGDSQAQAPRAI